MWIYYYYGKNDGTFPTQATLQTLVLRAPVPGRDVGGRRHQRHHLHLERHLGLLARPWITYAGTNGQTWFSASVAGLL